MVLKLTCGIQCNLKEARQFNITDKITSLSNVGRNSDTRTKNLAS
jgi:hypothetical protein